MLRNGRFANNLPPSVPLRQLHPASGTVTHPPAAHMHTSCLLAYIGADPPPPAAVVGTAAAAALSLAKVQALPSMPSKLVPITLSPLRDTTAASGRG
ncbi:hypothetical protein G7Z17_g13369 [Cylindrodendrum hubeiense]|uniref:Uncharacterized protein n=1 Tax=Cylindrodendrum hubeiense TaxID=595255 RepID=A0A9P5L9M0_9HYPO|nr:hypothetical protein G7Z17_g13369 [Cylindrodendrum hubeiense]